VRFVVDKVALGQVFILLLRFIHLGDGGHCSETQSHPIDMNKYIHYTSTSFSMMRTHQMNSARAYTRRYTVKIARM
jgi:hypothetical protein